MFTNYYEENIIILSGLTKKLGGIYWTTGR